MKNNSKQISGNFSIRALLNRPPENQQKSASTPFQTLLSPETLLDYYSCPRCNSVPQIQLQFDGKVMIHCVCYKKIDYDNVNLYHSIYDDDTDPRSIYELSKYQFYYISLSRYLKEIKVNLENPPCCQKENHDKELEGKIFCADCQNWYCSKCFSKSNEKCKNHLSYASKGLIIKSKCSNSDCENHATHYCEICKQNFCFFCVKTMKSNKRHEFHNINDILPQDKLNKICEEILELFQQNNNSVESIKKDLGKLKAYIEAERKKAFTMPDKITYTTYLNAYETRYKNSLKFLGQLEEENNKLKQFFQSLLSLYYCTKNVNNYNIRFNILAFYDNIVDINNYIQNLYKSKIKIRNYTLDDYLKKGYLIAEFYIKEDEEDYNDKSDYDNDYGKEIKKWIINKYFDGLNEFNAFMEIDDKKVPFSQEFRKGITGYHKVKIQMKQGKILSDMKGLFENCTSLATVDFSNFDSSHVTNMNDLFYHCSSLTFVNFAKTDTTNVTTMSRMFYHCSKINSINLSTLNTSNVTDLSELFKDCSKLSNVNLTKLNISHVTNMSYMFYSCTKLHSLDLSNFKKCPVTNMESMFEQCVDLNSLDLSNFNPYQVNNMGCMFEECIKLTSLNLSGLNASQATNMIGMFFQCISLPYLNLSSFDTKQVTNMISMFRECSSLCSLELKGFCFDNCCDKDVIFEGCGNLDQKTISTVEDS